MATTQLDSLEIVISTNTKQANQGIRSLTKNLDALQTFVSDKLDLGTITTLEEHLQNISKIDFTNVSQGLKDVVSAFKALQSKALSKGILKNAPLTPAETTPASYDTSYLQEEGAIEMSKTVEWIDPAQAEQTKGVIQTIIDYFKKLRKETDQVGDSSKKSATKFGKLVNAFKRVLFYRVVRRILQLIAQALKEGIQNMALFDEDFNKTMSNIKSSITYLKNSLGTLLAPLFEMLEPFIVSILDGLSNVANKLSEAFSIIAGKDTYTKAIKGAEDYAESLNKIKKTALGIDELNILNPQEQGGNFEKAEVEKSELNEALGEFGTQLRGLLGDVFGFLKEYPFGIIGKLLPTILPAILPLIEPIRKILNILMDIVGEVLENIVDILGLILPPLVKLVEGVLNIIIPILNILKPVITSLFEGVEAIFRILSPALDIVCDMTKGLFDFVGQVISILQPIFDVLNWIYEKMGGETVDRITTYGGGNENGRWDDGYQFGDALGQVVDWVKDGWNWFKGALGFATGGFPEDGLFFANHTELIGQFSNGKTAVANNEQIVEGIKEGVYEAMILAGGNNDKGGIQLAVYLDSVEIAKRVEQRNISRKDNNIVGAYKYGS